jgi:hypothetical protein
MRAEISLYHRTNWAIPTVLLGVGNTPDFPFGVDVISHSQDEVYPVLFAYICSGIVVNKLGAWSSTWSQNKLEGQVRYSPS